MQEGGATGSLDREGGAEVQAGLDWAGWLGAAIPTKSRDTHRLASAEIELGV